jgi:hypothetical protein
MEEVRAKTHLWDSRENVMAYIKEEKRKMEAARGFRMSRKMIWCWERGKKKRD